jgi:phosphodiesterase/alkaline phosphatase D-like protein
MTIHLGPILGFQGYDESKATWKLSAIIVADGTPPDLKTSSATKAIKPANLWTYKNKSVYRYDFSAKLQTAESTLTYEIAGKSYSIALPAKNIQPRLFYASCNGFSSLKVMKSVNDKNALWRDLLREHTNKPHHLFLMGGDQVYADSMWETVPTMKAWNLLTFDKGNAALFTRQMGAELEEFYFNLYCERWSQPEVAEVFARIPTLMMWDDHDIIDGWGSYPPARQNCAVYQGMFKIARKAFAVFQRHLPESVQADKLGYAYSWAHQIGKLAIVGLDMRTERSENRVMSPEHWDAVYDWIDALEDVEHLLVMSSIPVVYPGFDVVERLLGFVPGQQELEDDLRDHWNSRPHKGERLRLIHRLMALMTGERKIRPTLLSGDVHVAAAGVLESSRENATNGKTPVINQLISSAIVHPGPPAVMLFALRYLFSEQDEVDRGIMARMTEFPGTKVSFIGKRNFLALQPDDATENARLWANWFIEGEKDPYTKVIHPVA